MLRFTAAVCLAGLMFAPQAQAEIHEVKMLNRGGDGAMVYEPDHLRIAPGDSVRFIPTHASHNAATLPALWPKGTEPFKGKLNQATEQRFSEPGLYGIQCIPHLAMGMVMLIQVGDADLSAAQWPSDLPARAATRLQAQRAKLEAGR
ncbi:pseudoazurin [Pseudomonas sp. MLB6B]